jgi:hypothetical protein
VSSDITKFPYRLDINTMFKVREWERYKFMIDYEHWQASDSPAPKWEARAWCTADGLTAAAPTNLGAQTARKSEVVNSKEDRK